MQLTFLGATHEVTGSCFYLTACGRHIVIDCGMEQGVNEYENRPLPVGANQIDYVLLTHAHIDHSGMLPALYKDGFHGSIHATEATTALCDIMLRDSAHIQEFEAEWRNRKGRRSGAPEFLPAYTTEDALGTIERLVAHPYNARFLLCDGIEVRFVDVGHLLGSSSIEVWVTEDGVTRKLVFSGDIGNNNQPLLRDPQMIAEADYVIMESTYGNRSHGERPNYVPSLAAIIQRTLDRGGNLVIPSFAVGRTQEMLYFIRQIKAEGLVTGHDNFPVYVDSPLAVEATNIFQKNARSNYDDEAMALVNQGVNPLTFPGLTLSVSSEESKAINFDKTPKVIISASGMCEAGRIKHHLKHNLWKDNSTILFVGYQAAGTTGRAIVEGAEQIKLFGESIEIRAEVTQLPGVSGHADRDGLLRWIDAFGKTPKQVFVVHGDDPAIEAMTDTLRQRGLSADAPFSGSCYDLAAGVWLEQAEPVRVLKESYAAKRAAGTFARLLAAGKRLLGVIESNEGGPNKDLARFADQIISLCDKWER